MKYFDEIYQGAKNRDDKTLVELFKKGACIDTRNKTELLNTPAGLLAQEGDIESAKYLVEFYGANPAFVALGLMIANNQEEANKWLEQYEMNEARIFSSQVTKFSKAIYTCAFDTEIKLDTKTLHNTKHEAKAVTGEFDLHEFAGLSMLHKSSYLDALAHGGHIYLVEAIFKHSVLNTMPSLNSLFSTRTFVVEIGLPVFRLQTEKLALHAFSFIKDDKFLAAILKKIVKDGFIGESFNYDIQEIINRSRIIRTIMKEEGMGYSKALSVCDQRDIKLTPLLDTSLLFFNKKTNLTINPGAHEFQTSIKYSIDFGNK